MEDFFRRIAVVYVVFTLFEFLHAYFFQGPRYTLNHFSLDVFLAVIFYQQSRVLHYKNLCKEKDVVIAQRLPPESSGLQL